MRLSIRRNPLWVTWLLFLTLGAKADPPADQILGRWQFPSKGSSVDIYRVGNQYFARVAEVDKAGEKNYGLVKDKILIRNLTFDGQVWADGDLVHPKTGVTLSVEVHLIDPHTITVTVYKVIKLFHKKFNMTRQLS